MFVFSKVKSAKYAIQEGIFLGKKLVFVNLVFFEESKVTVGSFILILHISTL